MKKSSPSRLFIDAVFFTLLGPVLICTLHDNFPALFENYKMLWMWLSLLFCIYGFILALKGYFMSLKEHRDYSKKIYELKKETKNEMSKM